MARDLTSGVITEITSKQLRPANFVEIEFSGGVTRMWTGLGDKSWDGKTWTGVGDLLQISAIRETSALRAVGAKISLSGIPSSMVTKVLDEVRQGKPAKIYILFLDQSENVIADPYRSFSGRVDTGMIEEGGETSTITIAVENLAIDFSRPRGGRHTAQSQKAIFAGDEGYEFVDGLQEKDLQWGFGSPIPRAPTDEEIERREERLELEEDAADAEYGSGTSNPF